MNENRDKRLPVGIIWLLIYQWILVLVSLGYPLAFLVIIIKDGGFSDYADFLEFGLYGLVPASWGTAMVFACVAMTRRSPRGFRVGMICHLLVAILSMIGFIGIGSVGVFSSLSASHEARGFAQLFLLFALMWLPTLIGSGWGFFYLREFRKSLPT